MLVMILSIVLNRFETVAAFHTSIVLLRVKLARARSSMTDGSTVCTIELLLAASQAIYSSAGDQAQSRRTTDSSVNEQPLLLK